VRKHWNLNNIQVSDVRTDAPSSATFTNSY
jgi:hypothetical protein